MLRKIRITLATVFWLLVTWLLVDFTGTAHVYLGWMAKVQLMPALLSLNVGVLIFLLALTLLWGRIYCSVICPLGIMQDIISWFRRKKFKYAYTQARTALRYGMVLFTGAALLLNLGWLAGLILPYSTYGRITGTIVAPLYKMGNNLLAQLAEHYNSYAVYEVDVWLKSIGALAIAIITWGIIAVLAWRGGRTWCNTICPVGTLLGLLSRHALFRPVINKSRCNACGLCERSCKAGCINSKNHSIDLSRCVMCGNCMEACKKEALTLAKATEPAPSVASFGKNAPRKGNDNKPNGAKDAGTRAQNKPQNKPMAQSKPEDVVAASVPETTDAPNRKPRRRKPRTSGEENTIDSGRRAVLASTALIAGAAVLRAQHKPKTTDGGYAPIIKKTAPQRQHRITPPGSLSVRNLQSHCTACQLCVDACPNDVLRPSTRLSTFMQPEVSYERGYCRPECNRCSEVCPTGAIKPITIEERTATQVGHAVWVKELCIPAKEGKPCGNCSRRCPAGAIQLVPANDKYRKNEHGRWIGPDGKQMDGRLVPMIPVVNVEKCTGCGACENLCPVGPQSAIYVEGHDVHREI